MIPETFGRYEIKEEIGRGGMATVYKAYDPLFDREVAIKVLPPNFLHDPTFRERFKREAKTIASLQHRAIVPVYDFGEEDNQPYLVMRYMNGGTLRDRLRRGSLNFDYAKRISVEIATALSVAHERGIYHRDLKPDNILFDEFDSPFLSDFGIAKLAAQTQTFTQGILGTPQYMSPEQWRAKEDLDGRCDQYALGIILYQMLTGDLPFRAKETTGYMQAHLNEPVPDIEDKLPTSPHGISSFIRKTMSKDPDERYATMSGWSEDLERVGTKNWSPSQAPTRDMEEGSKPAEAVWQTEKMPLESELQPEESKGFPLWIWGVGGAAALGVIVLSFWLISVVIASINGEPTPESLAENPTPSERTSSLNQASGNETAVTSTPEVTDESTNSEEVIPVVEPTSPSAAGDPDGPQITLQFGERGNGPGQFFNTMHIATDGEGNIYTADLDDGRVQKFDAQGEFVSTWETNREFISQFVANTHGQLFIVDSTSTILIFDGESGEILRTIDFKSNLDVFTLAPDGSLVVYYSDPDDTLVFYNADFTVERTIPRFFSQFDEDVAFFGINSLLVSRSGDIFAQNSDGVFQFDSDGEFQGKVAALEEMVGLAPEEELISNPQAIATDRFGRLLVFESSAIKVYDRENRYLETVSVGQFGIAGVSLVLTDDDQILSMDVVNDKVIKIDLALEEAAGPPMDETAEPLPPIVGETVPQLTLQFGEAGRDPGQFEDTRWLAVDGRGHIFTADFDGGRIQRFDENGVLLNSWNTGGDLILDIVADEEGQLYVINDVGTITIYSGSSGEVVQTINTSGDLDLITLAPNGNLVAYVGWQDDQLVYFNSDFQVERTVPNFLGSFDEDIVFFGIADFAIDSSGRIFANNDEYVYRFNADGVFEERLVLSEDISEDFLGPGLLYNPTATTVDDQGRLYIADWEGIKIFDGDGRYISAVMYPKPGSLAFSLVVTSSNEIIAMDRNESQVLKFTPDN